MSLREIRQHRSSNSILWDKHLLYRASSSRQLPLGCVAHQPNNETKCVSSLMGETDLRCWVGSRGLARGETLRASGKRVSAVGPENTTSVPLAEREPWETNALLGCRGLGVRQGENRSQDIGGNKGHCTEPQDHLLRREMPLPCPHAQSLSALCPKGQGSQKNSKDVSAQPPPFPFPRLTPSLQAYPHPWTGGEAPERVRPLVRKPD